MEESLGGSREAGKGTWEVWKGLRKDLGGSDRVWWGGRGGWGKVNKGSGDGEEVWGMDSSGKGSGKDMPPPNIHHSQTIINLRWVFTATAAIPCGRRVY